MDNVTGGMETSRQTYDDKLTAVESDLKKLGNLFESEPQGQIPWLHFYKWPQLFRMMLI